ncbi:hypothetical protein WICPIJ_008220 [Wickerhamomyces pijperi]|uniref:Uncharacterized protein n=1 Tax=Wickerhamomyces pijperi TaxID=599730 RepID=A0A9P8TJ65_WICPI|nr:hypothetical protein WICPIJ_008220 [Wickerhamomyces pijperi]
MIPLESTTQLSSFKSRWAKPMECKNLEPVDFPLLWSLAAAAEEEEVEEDLYEADEEEPFSLTLDELALAIFLKNLFNFKGFLSGDVVVEIGAEPLPALCGSFEI